MLKRKRCSTWGTHFLLHFKYVLVRYEGFFLSIPCLLWVDGVGLHVWSHGKFIMSCKIDWPSVLVLYMVHTSYLLIFYSVMSHKFECWKLLRLCSIKIKLYYEIIHFGLMILYIIFWIGERNEINMIYVRWPLCWMPYCDLCCLFDKLGIIQRWFECDEYLWKIYMLIFKIWGHAHFISRWWLGN